MRSLGCLVVLFTLIFLGVLGSAQEAQLTSVPNLIRYGGVLNNAQRSVRPGTTLGVTFAIYRQQEGGAPVWLETQNVTPDTTGHYSVLLGSSTAAGLPTDLFSAQEERWLGVKIEGQQEQSRILLVSVPYAMKAAEADKLAGRTASEFVTTDSLQAAVKEQVQQQIAVATSSSPLQLLGPSAYINNGTALQTSANFNIDGTGTAAILNATSNYSLAGAPVLGNSGAQGLFLGAGAGQSNTGSYNLFLGIAAGHSNTTADYNTFIGTNAGYNNTTGAQNFMLGATAGYHNTTGSYNMFVGSLAGYNTTTGTRNVFVGRAAGYGNITGTGNSFLGANAGSASTANFNTFLGGFSGAATTTGNNNTFVGWQAGETNVTGSNNTFVGYNVGSAAGTTSNNDIYLASPGAANEAGVIRIGDPANQSATYIAGISGASTNSGVPVFIDSSGKLGTTGGNFNISGNVTLVGDLTATNTAAGGSAVAGNDNASTGSSSGVSGTTSNPHGSAVIGNATATTGNPIGVLGLANTLNGFGVEGVNTVDGGVGIYGHASNTTGTLGTWGILGETDSGGGGSTGVRGKATSLTGIAHGVHGTTNSATDNSAGVAGNSTATTGQVYGVSGLANSTTNNSAGVNGYQAAATGQVLGVSGYTQSTGPNAAAVGGIEGATTGVVYGVVGVISTATDRTAGVLGISNAGTGLNAGVAGVGSSSGGTGGYFQNTNTQAGSLLIDAVDANAAQRFTVDNLGNVTVTTGTTMLVTTPLMPVNHGRTTVSLTTNVTSTVAVNWAFAFVDTNYTVTCTPMLASGGPQVYLFQVSAINAGSISVDVAASGPFPGQLTINCTGVHD